MVKTWRGSASERAAQQKARAAGQYRRSLRLFSKPKVCNTAARPGRVRPLKTIGPPGTGAWTAGVKVGIIAIRWLRCHRMGILWGDCPGDIGGSGIMLRLLRVLGLPIAATLACAVAPAARAEPGAHACAREAFRVVVDVGHTAQSPGATSARGV